jgi:glycosyltransferase involved in cell wall biosynthesis
LATTVSTPKVESRSTKGSFNVNMALVALVGKRDEPTDALRDYCAWLGEALGRRGIAMATIEVLWDGQGWLRALIALWKQSAAWRGRWVVLQYTALMWSRRGFPLAVPAVLWMMKIRGCRTAVVFHDVYAVPDSRWIDRVRVKFQVLVMRHVCRRADRAIFPVPVDQVPWLSSAPPNAAFVPVGANIPSRDDLGQLGPLPKRVSPPAVAVFGVSSCGWARNQEVEHIAQAMRQASADVGELRLSLLGRGTKEAELSLRRALAGSRVKLTVDGLLRSEEVTARLSSCDVLLFVRGPLSSRRGSGLAGIACGLPVVAYEGRETGIPLRNAGVLFAPQNDVTALGGQLLRVLRDEELRRVLASRSTAVFNEWFSWDRIAERLSEVLRG